jgi:hypothetical protein
LWTKRSRNDADGHARIVGGTEPPGAIRLALDWEEDSRLPWEQFWKGLSF